MDFFIFGLKQQKKNKLNKAKKHNSSINQDPYLLRILTFKMCIASSSTALVADIINSFAEHPQDNIAKKLQTIYQSNSEGLQLHESCCNPRKQFNNKLFAFELS